jgi:hypothetical protein
VRGRMVLFSLDLWTKKQKIQVGLDSEVQGGEK